MIATKLFVPTSRRGLVTRPRLSELLRRGAESRLTLVSAPAGFGKTTLLAAWLGDGGDRCVAWVSLDPADSEPASFWTYVVTALHAAVPGVGSGAPALLASSPLHTELVLTMVVNELAAVPGEVWLVLDDYHLVDNRDVDGGMAFLLEHLPRHVHVVISTRADPDLPLARWRGCGELVEIRAADLRFTSDETAEYLNEAAGLGLDAVDVGALGERTEGWIAALQLAALSLRGRVDVGGFVARFAGNDRYIVDYLAEEVLSQQSDAVREFLLHSAVLDRITGPLCDAVTGGGDGSDMLVALERANLFLVPLDDRRQWYRYHHLFADVLRARLLSEQPEQVPVLHQRASRWYELHDLAEDAVRHALIARDVDRAVHLMELAVPTVRRNRQDGLLIDWLKALPDDAVRRSPLLSVVAGWRLMVSGELDAAEPWFDGAERAVAGVSDGLSAESEELRTLLATIAIHRAGLAQARGDVPGTTQQARIALDLAGPDDHLARGGAAGFLGLAAWAAGDVSGALPMFTHAVASLHAAGNLVDELSSTVVLADMWLAAGRPSKARQLYRRGLAAAQGDPVPQGTADLHVGLSELDREAGDLRSAKEHLETAAALGEHASTPHLRYRWFVAMGRVAATEGDLDRGFDLLDRAEQLYLRGVLPEVRPVAAMKARVRIAQGELADVTGWARDRGVFATDDVAHLREFDHLTMVRLLIARHRTNQDTGAMDEAVGLLDRLLDAAGTSGRAGSRVEIRMLQALAHDAQGHRPRAHEALDRVFSEAPEPEAYARLFLDEGAPMTALLRDAEQHDVGGDHARRLLSLGASFDAVAPAAGQAGPLTEREIQVLRLLAGELSGPQIARDLYVSHNTLRTHTKHIFTKLEVTTRRAAVRSARDRGLL
ncbi:LuxR C-terminal-related transcriptional regulator [Pseudonocardia broussonetiae]|uniref:LuxR C-terminal-related transcriptional regulator n=1 Tax=Pseudonocardia broussonetiae TaxID=2736640 RepID=UPI001F04B18C|nr:LuxR C-terminal-related transcriptional regulator [Pseudonocardia broussonetiae]